jgi:hypothetical protein
MSWESTGDFKTLDDIIAYGNAKAEAEREEMVTRLQKLKKRIVSPSFHKSSDRHMMESHLDLVDVCIDIIQGKN